MLRGGAQGGELCTLRSMGRPYLPRPSLAERKGPREPKSRASGSSPTPYLVPCLLPSFKLLECFEPAMHARTLLPYSIQGLGGEGCGKENCGRMPRLECTVEVLLGDPLQYVHGPSSPSPHYLGVTGWCHLLEPTPGG